jgi:putative tryptophan/tyrosine transport system substrate-binding protein
MLNMKRREFITLLGGAASAWPLVAGAQSLQRATAPVRVGVLASYFHPPLRRMLQKLKELGYVESETIRFEYRFAEGHDDRYRAMAVHLVTLPVDLIVTSGTPAALAAKSATATIPIVMGSVGEAVSTGLVASVARPGGNITGFSAVTPELESKRLEVLKELIPRLSRVGILANTTNPLFQISLKNLRPAAEQLGVALAIFEVRDRNEIDGALLKLVQTRSDAALIAADTLLLNNRREIVEALGKNKLPAIYPFREYIEVGGLLAHGANLTVLFERAAAYVDRILKGAKPADLPVQQATAFELIINLKSAKMLGIEVPATLLARADEVIE